MLPLETLIIFRTVILKTFRLIGHEIIKTSPVQESGHHLALEQFDLIIDPGKRP